MSVAWFTRFIVFNVMGIIVGIVSAFSIPGAVAAAVIAFGYGVSEICDAIAERRSA